MVHAISHMWGTQYAPIAMGEKTRRIFFYKNHWEVEIEKKNQLKEEEKDFFLNLKEDFKKNKLHKPFKPLHAIPTCGVHLKINQGTLTKGTSNTLIWM